MPEYIYTQRQQTRHQTNRSVNKIKKRKSKEIHNWREEFFFCFIYLQFAHKTKNKRKTLEARCFFIWWFRCDKPNTMSFLSTLFLCVFFSVLVGHRSRMLLFSIFTVPPDLCTHSSYLLVAHTHTFCRLFGQRAKNSPTFHSQQHRNTISNHNFIVVCSCGDSLLGKRFDPAVANWNISLSFCIFLFQLLHFNYIFCVVCGWPRTEFV